LLTAWQCSGMATVWQAVALATAVTLSKMETASLGSGGSSCCRRLASGSSNLEQTGDREQSTDGNSNRGGATAQAKDAEAMATTTADS